jgi:hypothetical protein
LIRLVLRRGWERRYTDGIAEAPRDAGNAVEGTGLPWLALNVKDIFLFLWFCLMFLISLLLFLLRFSVSFSLLDFCLCDAVLENGFQLQIDVSVWASRAANWQVMGFPIGGDYLSITEGVLSRIEAELPCMARA